MKLMFIAGARPNFMKVAPLIHELKKDNKNIEWKLVHTGQHYDYEMSESFFEELDIPKPNYFLSAGGGTHAEQTAKIMVEFEKIIDKEQSDIVVVVGDVNSTLACAIVAKKSGSKVAHIEAGLRSGDMNMPEEINRIITDSISDYFFVTEQSAVDNLKQEGKPESSIFFTGNVMMDSLSYGIAKIDSLGMKGPDENKYAVVTLHRPANVDFPEKLEEFLDVLHEISKDIKIYFSVHPRTKKNIEKFGLGDILADANVEIVPPLSYLNFIVFLKNADVVLTDSGGIQEEATFLGVPCLTLRDNTERPATVSHGTNILAGTKKESILDTYSKFKNGEIKVKKSRPKFWDGKSAERIIRVIQSDNNHNKKATD